MIIKYAIGGLLLGITAFVLSHIVLDPLKVVFILLGFLVVFNGITHD